MVEVLYLVIVSLISGVIGGLGHDLLQYKGVLHAYHKDPNTGEIYLGFYLGLILGGMSGLVAGLVLPMESTISNAAYLGLTAGLSFKGLADAYTEPKPKPQAPAQPQAPSQPQAPAQPPTN